jgi:hypothetical protein
VKTRVKDLLEAVFINPPERIKPSYLQKLINSLKLRKARGVDSIPNKCLRQLPKRPSAFSFSQSWKEAKMITLPKPGKDPKFPQNLHPIRLLSTTNTFFERVVLRIFLRHIVRKN